MIYTSSDQLKGKTLSRGDTIIFKLDGTEIKYIVHSSYLCNSHNKSNDYIFKVLDIENKISFCRECYKYEPYYGSIEDVFPESENKDFIALTSVAFALLKLCEEKFGKKLTNKSILKSLYQVDDKIIIKKEYDSGCNSIDYPYGFPLWMLKKYGGKIGVIKNIRNSHLDVKSCKMFIEPFYYDIEIDGMKCPEMFSASMFEGKKENKEIFTFTDTDIPNYYQYSYAILDLCIQEYKERYPHLTLKECFHDCIKGSLSDLFCFNNSIFGRDFWLEIVRHGNKSYIPEMYEPKYYSPTSLLKEDTYSSESLKSTLDYDDETTLDCDDRINKHNSEEECKHIVIPCSYEEVKLSIKNPKIKF